MLFEYHQPVQIDRIIGSGDTSDCLYIVHLFFCKLFPDQMIRLDNHIGHMVYSISEYHVIDLLWIQYIYIRLSNILLIVPHVNPIQSTQIRSALILVRILLVRTKIELVYILILFTIYKKIKFDYVHIYPFIKVKRIPFGSI